MTIEGTSTEPGTWALRALLAAIARAREASEDRAQLERTADEIRRALVQVQRCCREAERAAIAALEKLASHGGDAIERRGGNSAR